jgi:hypothetical protein
VDLRRRVLMAVFTGVLGAAAVGAALAATTNALWDVGLPVWQIALAAGVAGG